MLIIPNNCAFVDVVVVMVADAAIVLLLLDIVLVAIADFVVDDVNHVTVALIVDFVCWNCYCCRFCHRCG